MIPPPLDAESLLQHAAFVRSVALATLKGADLVDDAVQDTYLAALEHGGTRKGALRPWLGGVARRKAALLLRGRAASRRREARGARPDHSDDVAEIAARAETGRRLIKAVLGLEEPYRAVLLMRYYEGLPPRTIAKRLERPVETVRTRIKRGLERLRLLLEEKEGRVWRTALLPLAAPALAQAGIAGAAIGSVAMSKNLFIVGALLLVLLGAGAWFLHLSAADKSQPDPAPLLAGTSGSVPATPAQGPTLAARPTTAVMATYPSDVDRELDLHGVVVDQRGRPIEGALLSTLSLPWMRSHLLPDLSRWAEEKSGPATRSAANGSFILRVPSNSRWNLRVTAAGFATKTHALLRSGERVRVVLGAGVLLQARVLDAAGKPVPGARVHCVRHAEQGDVWIHAVTQTDAEGLALLAGLAGGYEVQVLATHPAHGTARKRLKLSETHATSIDLKIRPGRTVSGTVSDRETGTPIEGARVGFPWTFAVETLTDAEGRFELAGWSREAGSLHVLAAGYAREQQDVPESDEVEVALQSGVIVTGRVLSSDGAALQGVPVAASGSIRRGGEELLSNAFTYTGAAGNFTLRGLRRRMGHTLHVVAPGHAHRRLPFTPVLTGAPLDLGDVRLTAPARIVGTLHDGDGEPVARRELLLQGPTVPARERSYEDRESAFTDDLGRFSFGDLARGVYGLSVKDSPIHLYVEVLDRDVATLEVRLPADNERRVIVIDDTGRAVAGVNLSLQGRNRTIGTKETDPAGIARFSATQDPTHITIYLSKAQRRQYLFIQQAKWPEGQAEARIVLRVGQAVSGRLLNQDGSPYPHAHLAAWLDGQPIGTAWSDEKGHFLLQLPAGAPVDLVVDGQVQTHFPIRDGVMKVVRKPIAGRLEGVEPGATDLTLTVIPIVADRSLRVLVLDPDGRPMADVHVFRLGREANDVPPKTDANGRVVFENLLPTPFDLQISAPPAADRTLGTLPIKQVIPNGQEVTIQLHELLVVRGFVGLPSGLPAVDAKLGVSVPDVLSSLRSDMQGEFLLLLYPEHLPVRIHAKFTDPSGVHYEGEVEVRDKSSLPANIRLAPKQD